LGDRLYLAPIKKGGALKILDVGTGTGIWAIEMGISIWDIAFGRMLIV
jgi:ubiquinone/menaquinone biosynthesis C-methylase UbiE